MKVREGFVKVPVKGKVESSVKVREGSVKLSVKQAWSGVNVEGVSCSLVR